MSNITNIIDSAEGTIDENLLTKAGSGGYISTGYLQEKPLIEYLNPGESLEFLFDNTKKGVTVTREHDTRNIKPGSNYRTILAVTSDRIICVVGRSDGDSLIEIPLSDISSTDVSPGFTKDLFKIQWSSGVLEFYTRPDPEISSAAEYIEKRLQELVDAEGSQTPSEQSRTNGEISEPDSDGKKVQPQHNEDSVELAEAEMQSTVGANTTTAGASFPEYLNQASASNSTLEILQDAEAKVNQVDTEVDDVQGAIEELTRAHNSLCQVLSENESGINQEKLEERIGEVEEKIETLQITADHLNSDSSNRTTETKAGNSSNNETQTKSESDSNTARQNSDGEGNDTDYSEENQGDHSVTESSEAVSPTRENLIETIEEAASALDRLPKYDDMHDFGPFDAKEYSKEFKSWFDALEATDIDVEQILIDDLQSVGAELGRAPLRSEIDEYAIHSTTRHVQYFESYDKAISAADLEDPSQGELLADLRRLKADLGYVPTSTDVDEYGEFTTAHYRKEFTSVKKAVAQDGMDYESDLIAAIQALALGFGRSPKSVEFDEFARYSSNYVYEFFDDWESACMSANVGSDEDVDKLIEGLSLGEARELIKNAPVNDELPSSYEDRIEKSTQEEGKRAELLEKLESAIEDIGRLPTYTDMYDYEGVTPQDYSKEFGSWDNALRATDIDIEARLRKALRDLGTDLGRAPTKAEVDEQGLYDRQWYDDYFESWEDAVEEAGFSYPSASELLDEIQRLERELGFVPAKKHVEEHGTYPSQFYRREFDSVKQAVSAAGLSYRDDLIDEIRNLAIWLGERPTTADFEEHGEYSSGYIYDYFDSWSDACEVAGVNSDDAVQESLSSSDVADKDSGSDPDEIDVPKPSPLAEYYEAFGNLAAVQQALFGNDPDELFEDTESIRHWMNLIHDRWAGDPPDEFERSYGEQQNERADFTMGQYRDEYGDGEQIAEFQAINTESLSAAIVELVSMLSGMDRSEAATIQLPESPESGEPLPVLVESTAELERAESRLNEFPEEPLTSVKQDDKPDAPNPPQGEKSSKNEDAKSPDNNKEASDTETDHGELTDIGGVTQSVAESLKSAGYYTKKDLQEAETEELASIEGVGSQKATRIKLLVG